MNLLLDTNTLRVSREFLQYIPTPEPTETWKPVPHHKIAGTISDEAKSRGYIIASEEYGLSRDGKKMFGVLKFHPEGHPEYTRALGIRNSHDKTLALGIVAGLSVIVCSNLCFGGGTTIYRKHTSGIDEDKLIPQAFDCLQIQYARLEARVTELHYEMLSVDEAKLTVVRAAENRAIASCDILQVLREFKTPRHEEFRTPSAWSLYNAFTETAKKYSPMRAEYCYKSLGRLFRLE